MATSPNFGWLEPDNTDLVKNGALAIRTAINGVDTSMAGLKGGTTGQVLSKTSNTDMAFTWVAQDDSNAIQNAIVDAKGDIIAATANDTPARLAIGANNAFLKADSSTATGLVWDNSAWTSYTPSIGNGSVGNGTLTGFYKLIGKTCHFRAQFILGSTSTVSGDFALSGPFTNVSAAGSANAIYLDNSTQFWYNGFYYEGYPRYQQTFGTLSATTPFTWAVGDVMWIYGTFEVV